MKTTISVRNIDRNTWISFSALCRRQKKTTGEVLETIIKKHVEESREKEVIK